MPGIKDLTFALHTPIRVGLRLDQQSVRRRVLNLYKAWYRQLPVILYDYNLQITAQETRSVLRETFVENSRLTDLRVIDQLIIKGQIELNECVNHQKEPCHVMKIFDKRNRTDSKPKDFLGNFLQSSD